MFLEAEFGILYFLQALHTPWLDEAMKAITSLGDKGIIWILTGLVFLSLKRTRPMGLCILLSLTAGLLLGNGLIKNLAARSRPCWLDDSVLLLIKNPPDYSFPSGHTLAAFESAVSIWLYNRKWGFWAMILAVLMGVSRMYLFVHFPTDVLAGMVLGTVIAWGVHWLVEQGSLKKLFAIR